MLRLMGLGLVILTVAGCGDTSGRVGKPSQVTVYALDYRKGDGREDASGLELFFGFAVIGKAEVTSAERRQEIADALNEMVAQKEKESAKCFNPRHGVRVVEGGRTTEYAICFQCGNYRVKSGGSERFGNGRPPDVFTEPLRDAGISLAP